MTDLDAAAYLRELMEYNKENMLRTPQNIGFDTFWDCALRRAISALERSEGLEGKVSYERGQNGCMQARIEE